MNKELKNILEEVKLVGVHNKVPICFTHNQIKILYDYIENLQKQAELGEHYKHLYSEVKKQKDNGIKYIRENVYIDYYGISVFREKDGVDKLLRMLGEIE